MTTTDTPRTDAQYENNTSDYQRRLVSEDLERKLAAEIANRKKCCRDGNQISDELFDTQLKLKASHAEVERLKEQLESTKLLALKFWKVLEENGFKIELPK
jgi:hypothetical protein